MSAAIIDGKAAAERILADVAAASLAFRDRIGRAPGLSVVLVGEDPASQVYVRNKGREAERCGFRSEQKTLPATTGQPELMAEVDRLNRDPAVDGILVQFPLPKGLDADAVILAIDPSKDVDGLHPLNVGRLAMQGGVGALVSCTPMGSVLLIDAARGPSLAGLHAVVVGRSNLVGKPMAQLLLARDATVTIAHSKTPDLAEVVSRADIVVAAIGRPRMIQGAWIKPGATVIDVGINRVPAPDKGEGKTRLVGDVEFDVAVSRAGAITPVPGGVGAMTIAMLMANTVIAAHRREGLAPPRFSL